MSVVFLDTVGLLGLWDEDDQWHLPALEAYQQLKNNRDRIVTSTFILLECGNAAARTPFRLAVDRLRNSMTLEGGVIVPTDDDWHRAWTVYRSQDSTGAGIVDQVSFAIMRRLGIQSAFTNDRHFKSAGFQTLF